MANDGSSVNSLENFIKDLKQFISDKLRYGNSGSVDGSFLGKVRPSWISRTVMIHYSEVIIHTPASSSKHCFFLGPQHSPLGEKIKNLFWQICSQVPVYLIQIYIFRFGKVLYCGCSNNYIKQLLHKQKCSAHNILWVFYIMVKVFSLFVFQLIISIISRILYLHM